MAARDKPRRPRLVVHQGGGKKNSKPGYSPRSKPGRKPQGKKPPAPSKPDKPARPKKEIADWRDRAKEMGYENPKITIAQQVYIERAARLKVIVESLYDEWRANGFEMSKGGDYLKAEKQYGDALKAAGLNPLDDDPNAGGSNLVN